MEQFSGKCVGGPLNGQMLAHWAKKKKFYRPALGVPFSFSIENAPVVPVEIGEYQVNDFGQWHWWETEAGRALKVLYGEHGKKAEAA